MPKKILYTRENIIRVALDIIREDGPKSLSARNICKKMGCSVSPVFRAYPNMEELLADVRKEVEIIFTEYIADVLDYSPAFKELGMRLIRFSREEPDLFHYLFLEKNADCTAAVSMARKCLKQTRAFFELTEAQSEYIYGLMWPFVCGLAQLCNKNPEIYTEDVASGMLSAQFLALRKLVKSGEEVINIVPQRIDLTEI